MNSFTSLNPTAIAEAARRIAPYIIRTPLVTSSLLNGWLGGHQVYFKLECHQKTGAFKVRGALNALLALKEHRALPPEVAAFSSGNHAQAMAWAGKMLGVKTTIYLPHFTSGIKQQATRSYGAEVVITQTRLEAEQQSAAAIQRGAAFVHPSDDDRVIAGQGTACLEALEDNARPDAVFAPCGGGGLVAGSLLATRLFDPIIPVYAAEPLQANDAARSYQSGSIYRFADSPATLADGARTLSLSPRTFHYLQQLAGVIEVPEEAIIYWVQWLSHLLKISCEPTSALAMAAAHQWLAQQTKPKRVLIIISGGNLAPETIRAVWEQSCLGKEPRIN